MLYNILSIKIILKMRISSYYYTLLKELQYHGISVIGIVLRRKIAFMVLEVENYAEFKL